MATQSVNLKEFFTDTRVEPLLRHFADGIGWSVGTGSRSPRDVQPELEDRWEEQLPDGFRVVHTRFRIDGLLRVDVDYRLFPGGNALSLGGRILNDREEPFCCITRPCSFLYSLQVAAQERVFPVTLKGGLADSIYPPTSFTVTRQELPTYVTQDYSGCYYHGGLNGRSSNNDMPYFVVQVGETGGIFFALEWPGDWSCTIQRFKGKVWMEIGLEHIHLTLLGGESIPLPRCLVGAYTGDWIEGCNALRAIIAEHYTPRLGGEKMVPPVFYNSWWSVGLSCSEEVLRREAEACEKIGIEYVVQDAGWYAGCDTKGGAFEAGLGNWQFIHPQKYPAGLKPLSHFVRSKGMRFGIWIEPERCHSDSWLAREHPEWLANPPQEGADNLVDFGNPEVVAWFKETMDQLFEENHVEWVRFDSNIDPQPHWQRRDPPERKGISQIRHFEGLLDFWDHLLQHHPSLLIEGCSSGGRRMDLACLKRSHTYWCNDHTIHFDLVRYDLTGANLFLPANYLNHTVATTWAAPEDYQTPALPDFAYHCHMGGSFGFAEVLQRWDAPHIEAAKRHVEAYKQIRHLLMGKYCPLWEQPRAIDSWCGWQFHHPESNEGMFLLFRCLSPDDTVQVQPRWLQPATRYTVLDAYTGEQVLQADGATLSSGFTVTLEPRQSRLLRYRPSQQAAH